MWKRRHFLASLTALTPIGLWADEAPSADLAAVRRWVESAAQLKSLHVRFRQERRLRAVAKPLSSPGQLWFRAPNSFRWELGQPTKMAVLQRPGETQVSVIEPAEKKLTHYDLGAPDSSLPPSVAMLRSTFPRRWEDFDQGLKVEKTQPLEGFLFITCQARQRSLALAILHITLVIEEKTQRLHRFEITFRDGSKIITHFESFDENPTLSDSTFSIDTTGYVVKEG
jgi:outer membrane lipoprotein-sorting protein